MAKVRIELDREGVSQLLNSQEVQDAVKGVAESYARVATMRAVGAGYKEADFGVRTFRGRDRVRAHLGTENIDAILAEVNERTLTKVFNG